MRCITWKALAIVEQSEIESGIQFDRGLKGADAVRILFEFVILDSQLEVRHRILRLIHHLLTSKVEIETFLPLQMRRITDLPEMVNDDAGVLVARCSERKDGSTSS
jgi:hypothetical protein